MPAHSWPAFDRYKAVTSCSGNPWSLFNALPSKKYSPAATVPTHSPPDGSSLTVPPRANVFSNAHFLHVPPASRAIPDCNTHQISPFLASTIDQALCSPSGATASGLSPRSFRNPSRAVAAHTAPVRSSITAHTGSSLIPSAAPYATIRVFCSDAIPRVIVPSQTPPSRSSIKV